MNLTAKLRRAIQKRDALASSLSKQDTEVRTLLRQWADDQGLQAMPRLETVRNQL